MLPARPLALATCEFQLQLSRSNQPMNIARLMTMLQYSGEQKIGFDFTVTQGDCY